ncbi:MAG: hypothetical protein RLZZ624_668, partial [Cyanobacteriota bacterium]
GKDAGNSVSVAMGVLAGVLAVMEVAGAWVLVRDGLWSRVKVLEPMVEGSHPPLSKWLPRRGGWQPWNH